MRIKSSFGLVSGDLLLVTRKMLRIRPSSGPGLKDLDIQEMQRKPGGSG